MTTTDFFRFIIKALGTYCFINALFYLIPNISLTGGFYSFGLIVSLVYLLITGLIVYLLLLQTDRIIKFFRLAKGFDNNKIETKDLNTIGLFKLAIIFIGLLLITDNLAEFLDYCYLAFKNEVSANGLGEIEGAMLDQNLDYNWWLVSGLNILIGIIMLTNYNRISQMFTKNEERVD